ncbi:acyltransferase [Pseudomonas costantinii]|nr:acyltransferase [Pseudomonas costantinii]
MAAGIVLLIHALPYDYGLDWLFYKFWWVGPAGVDIFFVLSGFIVCYSASKAVNKDSSSVVVSGRFFLKRAARIFPVYWVALCVAWLVSSYVDLAPNPKPWEEYNPISYILLLTVYNNKVRPAWTLAYEMYFYVVLSLIMFVGGKNIYRWLLGWGAVTLVSIFVFAVIPGLGVRKEFIPVNPLVLEFALGCGVAFLFEKGVSGGGWASFIAGTLLFVTGCVINSYIGNWGFAWRAVLFGPASALIIYGLIDIERNGWRIFPRWLETFGDASYSLYIWHYVIIMVLMGASNSLGLINLMPGWLIVLAIILVCIAWSFISYRLIEKPSQKYFYGVIGMAGSKGKSLSV